MYIAKFHTTEDFKKGVGSRVYLVHGFGAEVEYESNTSTL